jgi:hypothetical protein
MIATASDRVALPQRKMPSGLRRSYILQHGMQKRMSDLINYISELMSSTIPMTIEEKSEIMAWQAVFRQTPYYAECFDENGNLKFPPHVRRVVIDGVTIDGPIS